MQLTSIKITRSLSTCYVVTRSDVPGKWILPTLIGQPQASLSRMTPYKGSDAALESVPDYIIKLGLAYCGFPVDPSCYSSP